MIDWMPGFERVDGNASGTFVPGVPMRFVLHTTESGAGSIRSVVQVLRGKNAWPHATVDPSTRERIQHIPLSVPSRALRNEAGGVETNREGVIQIEIVGRAAETHTWPTSWLDWLGTDVVGPMCRATGIRIACPLAFYGQDAGFTLATVNAPQRMSYGRWRSFDSICGHQHVPENTHWDPGKLDVARIVSAALGSPPAPAVPQGGLFMHLTEAEEREILAAVRGDNPKKGTTGERILASLRRIETHLGLNKPAVKK